MAELPRYGRKIAPAGPSQWLPHGTQQDMGLAAIEEVLGKHAESLRRTRMKMRAAEEGTQLLDRSAKFSIGMEKIFTDSMKQDGPDKQRAYWDQETEKLRQQLLDWSGSSDEARMELGQSLTHEQVRHDLRFMRAQEDRSRKQMEDSATLAMDTAVRTNNPVQFQMAVDKLEEINIYSPSMREQQMKEFPTKVALAQAQMTMAADPDTAMASLKTVLADKAITEDQRNKATWLYNLAKNEKEDQEKNRGQWWDSLKMDVFKKSETMTTGAIWSEIQQTPNLSEPQQMELMDTVVKGRRIFADTGRDPFRVTRDEEALAKAYIDIDYDRITSLDDLNARRFGGESIQWSNNDDVQVKSYLQAHIDGRTLTGQLDVTSPSVKARIDALNALYLDGDGNMKEPGTLAEYMTVRRRIEQAVKSDNPAPQIERVMTEAKEKKAKDWLEKLAMSGVAPGPRMGWWLMGKVADAYKDALFPKEPSKTQYPVVKSDEDFDRLPSGATFVDPDGKLRRKP